MNSRICSILILTACIILNSCFTQKSGGNPLKKSNLNYPQITSQPEVLDMSIFATRSSDATERDNLHILRNYSVDAYWEEDDKGNLLKELKRGVVGKSNILSYDYSKNIIFGVFKEYTPAGILITKGGYCWFGFNYGTWYYYDNTGKLIKTVDFDDGFSFDAQDILKYCADNSISLERRLSGPKTIIRKTHTVDGKPAWAIQYNDISRLQLISLLINGATGKVVKRHVAAMPLN